MHSVAFDWEKAFDSMRFDGVIGTVVHHPLSSIIRKLLCYQRLRTHATNLWLYPERETLQGDILSPLLFNAAIEVLHKKNETALSYSWQPEDKQAAVGRRPGHVGSERGKRKCTGEVSN